MVTIRTDENTKEVLCFTHAVLHAQRGIIITEHIVSEHFGERQGLKLVCADCEKRKQQESKNGQ